MSKKSLETFENERFCRQDRRLMPATMKNLNEKMLKKSPMRTWRMLLGVEMQPR